MHLITSLSSGIRGAEDGTATLYKRGTSTAATWYSDFEAASSNAAGSAISLDSNGGAVVYVNELVDVLVKDADGNTVREFVAGDAAPAVEYIGQSFTGTNYTSGATGASQPTNLQTILDLWKTSAGAIDFKVAVNGVSTILSTAVSALSGLFFNVKDATYGAVGDGVTNDTTAITAALTAANVNGGIVFFPPGSYRVTSALTLGAKTSLLGCGPAASAIGIDHASNNLFSVSGSSSYQQTVSGLRLLALQSNSGTLLAIGSADNLRVHDCTIGDSNSTGDVITAASSSSSTLLFEGCDITVGGTTKACFNGAGALNRGRFIGCTFNSPTGTYNATNGMVYGRQLDLVSCRFVNNATGGTYSCFKSNSTTVDAKVSACDFGSSGGATVTAMELGTYASGAVFYEANNSFGSSGVTAYSYTCAAASKGAVVQLVTRLSRRYETTDDSAAVTVPTDQYGLVTLKRTANGAQTITLGQPPEGGYTEFGVWNATGGAMTTPTITPASFASFPSVSNGAVATTMFVPQIFTNLRNVAINAISGWGGGLV